MSSIPPFPRHQKGQLVMTGGLYGCWRFYEGSGLVVHDISGTDRHGTLAGGTSWASGREGNCLSFDGTNDYVNLGGVALNFERTQPFSVVAWVKRASALGVIIGKMVASGGFRGWVVFTSGDKLSIILRNTTTPSSQISVTSVLSLSTTDYQHIAVTYNGSSLASGVKMYLDGASISTTTTYDNLIATMMTTSATSADIGAIDNSASFYKGEMDDVRVYSRVLSPEEVSLIYAGHG